MSETTTGRVYEARGGVYTVALGDGHTTVEASIRGRLKKSRDPMERVVVGDRVEMSEQDGDYVIESVHPRKTMLVRARLGGRYAKPIAANLDRVVVVVSADRPAPNPELIDRLLVLADAGGLEGALVINKLDLGSGRKTAEHLAALYEKVGYRVVTASAETGRGMDEVSTLLCSGSAILAGASGVGKSTLLREIDPALNIRVGSVGSAGGGRHTTVSSRLIPLACGGVVADSPGFSDASLWGIEPAHLPYHFPEMARVLADCHFRECTHLHEPKCAVRPLVASGEIAASRFRSYETFRVELESLAVPG